MTEGAGALHRCSAVAMNIAKAAVPGSCAFESLRLIMPRRFSEPLGMLRVFNSHSQCHGGHTRFERIPGHRSIPTSLSFDDYHLFLVADAAISQLPLSWFILLSNTCNFPGFARRNELLPDALS